MKNKDILTNERVKYLVEKVTTDGNFRSLTKKEVLKFRKDFLKEKDDVKISYLEKIVDCCGDIDKRGKITDEKLALFIDDINIQDILNSMSDDIDTHDEIDIVFNDDINIQDILKSMNFEKNKGSVKGSVKYLVEKVTTDGNFRSLTKKEVLKFRKDFLKEKDDVKISYLEKIGSNCIIDSDNIDENYMLFVDDIEIQYILSRMSWKWFFFFKYIYKK